VDATNYPVIHSLNQDNRVADAVSTFRSGLESPESDVFCCYEMLGHAYGSSNNDHSEDDCESDDTDNDNEVKDDSSDSESDGSPFLFPI